MHVETYGDGPDAYVGVHGWAGSHRTFRPLARRMPESATLYALDLPGCGKTPPLEDWRPPRLIDAMVETIAALPRRPVTLVGACSGATLSLLCAKELGGAVSRLVMIDPFAATPWYFRIFLWGAFGRRAYFTAFANPLGRTLTNGALRRRRRKTGRASLTRAFQHVDHDVTLRYLALFNQLDAVNPFRDMTLPTDILYGGRTFKKVKEAVRCYQAMWPHARVWPLPAAGHQPLEEAPDAVADIVFQKSESSTNPTEAACAKS